VKGKKTGFTRPWEFPEVTITTFNNLLPAPSCSPFTSSSPPRLLPCTPVHSIGHDKDSTAQMAFLAVSPSAQVVQDRGTMHSHTNHSRPPGNTPRRACSPESEFSLCIQTRALPAPRVCLFTVRAALDGGEKIDLYPSSMIRMKGIAGENQAEAERALSWSEPRRNTS
jgi:hypothetical protein